ncbi:carbohydrate kinase family protein [Terracidiphilus gabretensis]|uniref:carbohydrate kinase family protein n=1 Tax=Terracidiphilus gabretensis TaxID=1577687 RepID=UPI00071BB9A0|nr:carbohydrate kinase family protein [Terracidiphilus gabretensis]
MLEVQRVDLVGVGLNATDTLIPLKQFPVSGSKVEYECATVMAGGQAATTVAACQTWGLPSRYVGKLGRDDAARLHEREFERLGVDARLVYAQEGASPRSMILVDASGERTVICQRDPRLRLQPHEIKREWVTAARLLHIDGFDTEAAIQAARWAHEAGVLVVADLDEDYEGIYDLLPLIDYLIVSRDFPLKITGDHDLHRSLKELHTRFNCKLTAATLGPDGVLAWDGNEIHDRRAYCVPTVDTTGAGDIFHAGFIYGLLSGWELDRELDFACAAAAINCKFAGARGGIQDVEAIEQLMQSGERYR